MEAMKGKIAVLTGAAAGIGAEVARQFAAAGGRPVILDVNTAAGAAIAEETGGRFIRCDVASREEWMKAVQVLVADDEVPDYAHLNAGVMSVGADQPFRAIEDLPLANYRRIVSVNLDGVVFGLQALLPHMRERGGAICVTASLVGLIPLAIDPMYSATKHALVGLVRSVAAANEGAAVRVNAICPGGVDTAIVPAALRSQGMEMMAPATLAGEVIDLFARGDNGEIRLRRFEGEPAVVVPVPSLA